MYKILRIICCVLCALLCAACVFVFVYLGTFWGVALLVAAVSLFLLTLLFKGLQEDYEKKNTPSTRGDFITGAKPDDTHDEQTGAPDGNEKEND